MIEQIEIRHLRSYKYGVAAELSSKINFFGGLNAAGKSTLIDAISLALTGTCKGAETGRALDEMRRRDEDERAKHRWHVKLTLGGDHAGTELERKEGEGRNSQAQANAEAVLGIQGSALRALLYSGELIRLDRKDAQQLVLHLASPDQIKLSKAECKLVNDALGGMLSKPWDVEDTIDLVTCDRLNKMAREVRLEAGRKVREARPVEPTPPEGIPADAKQKNLSDLLKHMKETLSKLLAERDDLNRKIGAAATPGKRAAARALVKDEIEALEAWLDGVQPVSKDDIDAALRSLEEATSHRNDAASAVDLCRENLAATRGELVSAESRVKKFEQLKSEGKCPTCERKITKAKAGELANDYETALSDWKKTEAQDMKKLSEAMDALSKRENELSEANEKLRQTEARANDYSDKAGAVKRLKEKLDTLPEKEDENSENVEQLKAELDTIDRRVEIGTKKIQALDTYMGRLKAFREASETIVDEAKLQRSADELVAALESGGSIRAKLANTNQISEFQDKVNAKLIRMGYEVNFGPLLDGTDDPHVNHRPARLLSESEQIRFSVAFAVAAAESYSFPVVAVDRYEELDYLNAGKVMRILLESDVQSFVCSKIAATERAFREMALGVAKKYAGTRFFLVARGEDGWSEIEGIV